MLVRSKRVRSWSSFSSQVETFDYEGIQCSRSMLHVIMFHKDRAALDAEYSHFFFLNQLILDRDRVSKLPAVA